VYIRGNNSLHLERQLGQLASFDTDFGSGDVVMLYLRRALSVILSSSLIFSVAGLDGCAKKKEEAKAPAGAQGQAPTATYATPTPEQLYQLVAPIALFPDNLLAQVLAASTYPDQVTAAYNWLQQNSSLKGQQLLETVNQQPWDASVKGLTQFPDVLSQLATNLSWTSALGDAYFNVPQSVMNAVQVMRQRAYQAGNLKSSQQQAVTVQNQPPGEAPPPPAAAGEGQTTTIVQPPAQTIIIQPAQPDVVYVPTYNPTVVYGAPVAVYPGYSTGAMVATSLLSFGVGIAVGAAISGGGGCCGWGWNSWGCGWHNNTVVYNRNVYVSNSNTFVNRNNYYNRNNINNANINRSNINNANINRANVNNYRANNFDTNARNANFTEPKFNQKYDQSQFRNPGAQQQINQAERGGANQRVNQQAGGGNQPGFNQQPGGRNESRFNQQAGGNAQVQNRVGNSNQPQRDAARGYGQQQGSRGTNTGAFDGYSPGGNARTNSARGQQSLEGRQNQNFGGGGQRAAGGGGRAEGRAAGGGGRRR
jgi:hypothetical protein